MALRFLYHGPCNASNKIDFSLHENGQVFFIWNDKEYTEMRKFEIPPNMYELAPIEDMPSHLKACVLAFHVYMCFFFFLSSSARVVAMESPNGYTELVLLLGSCPVSEPSNSRLLHDNVWTAVDYLAKELLGGINSLKYFEVNPKCKVLGTDLIAQQIELEGVFSQYLFDWEVNMRKLMEGMEITKKEKAHYISIIMTAVTLGVRVAYCAEISSYMNGYWGGVSPVGNNIPLLRMILSGNRNNVTALSKAANSVLDGKLKSQVEHLQWKLEKRAEQAVLPAMWGGTKKGTVGEDSIVEKLSGFSVSVGEEIQAMSSDSEEDEDEAIYSLDGPADCLLD